MSARMPDLFVAMTVPDPYALACAPHSGTRALAHRAAARAARAAGATSLAIVRLLRRVPAGLTPDELAERLGRSILSVRPRVSELYWAGLIRWLQSRVRQSSLALTNSRRRVAGSPKVCDARR